MLKFKLSSTSEKNWKLYLKSPKEMLDIFYEDTEPEEGYSVHGITEYATSKIYISKDLDGFLLIKTLRHELMHAYLWELGKNQTYYSVDAVSEILGVAVPLICKTADELVLRLKEK